MNSLAEESLPDLVPHTLTSEERSRIESDMGKRLKDPYSARFERWRAVKVRTKGSLIVCFDYNAKNVFGGYVGRRPTIGMLLNGGDYVDWSFGAPPREIDAQCAKFGIP